MTGVLQSTLDASLARPFISYFKLDQPRNLNILDFGERVDVLTYRKLDEPFGRHSKHDEPSFVGVSKGLWRYFWIDHCRMKPGSSVSVQVPLGPPCLQDLVRQSHREVASGTSTSHLDQFPGSLSVL